MLQCSLQVGLDLGLRLNMLRLSRHIAGWLSVSGMAELACMRLMVGGYRNEDQIPSSDSRRQIEKS